MEYYTTENTKGEPFYKLPQVLFKDEKLKKLSCEAKVLYAIMQNRVTLSDENRWVNDDDRIFIYLTINEAMELVNCSRQKAINTLQEIKEVGLIEVLQQGLNKPNKIFVKQVWKSKNHTSGSLKIRLQEVQKLDSSKNDITKNDISKNNNNNNNNNNIYNKLIKNNTTSSTCQEENKENYIKFYLNNINATASAYELEKLTSWEDDLEPRLIKQAITIAVENNVRKYSYINSILNNWLNAGITTYEQWENSEKIKKEIETHGRESRFNTSDKKSPKTSKGSRIGEFLISSGKVSVL